MAEKGPRPVGDKSQINILIVEDDPMHVNVLRGYLEPAGYQLRVARSRDEGIEMLKTELPDLVVLDLRLDPDPAKQEGYEVCRWLRQNPKTATIPVLMFTVLAELEQIERGVEADTDDYLVKLSSPKQVRSRVEKLLMVRHIKDKLRRLIEYDRLVQGGREDDSPAPPPPRGD